MYSHSLKIRMTYKRCFREIITLLNFCCICILFVVVCVRTSVNGQLLIHQLLQMLGKCKL